MRTIVYLAVFWCALFVPLTAIAQSEGRTVETRPSDEVEAAIARVQEATASYFFTESYAPMVPPRVCRHRDFEIPPSVEEYADSMLHIDEGECVSTHPYYLIRDRAHRRLITITEEETLIILNALAALADELTASPQP